MVNDASRTHHQSPARQLFIFLPRRSVPIPAPASAQPCAALNLFFSPFTQAPACPVSLTNGAYLRPAFTARKEHSIRLLRARRSNSLAAYRRTHEPVPHKQMTGALELPAIHVFQSTRKVMAQRFTAGEARPTSGFTPLPLVFQCLSFQGIFDIMAITTTTTTASSSPLARTDTPPS